MTMQTVREYCNPELFIRHCINSFQCRSIIRREIAEMLEDTALHLDTKAFKTRIKECTAFVEAQAIQQSIYSYAPKSNASADYEALVVEMLEKEKTQRQRERKRLKRT